MKIESECWMMSWKWLTVKYLKRFHIFQALKKENEVWTGQWQKDEQKLLQGDVKFAHISNIFGYSCLFYKCLNSQSEIMKNYIFESTYEKTLYNIWKTEDWTFFRLYRDEILLFQ